MTEVTTVSVEHLGARLARKSTEYQDAIRAYEASLASLRRAKQAYNAARTALDERLRELDNRKVDQTP